MTEAEWMECDDPTPMVAAVRGKVSERKLRLFACACCRSVWHLLLDERSRRAVEVAERYADEPGLGEDLRAAHAAAWEVLVGSEEEQQRKWQAVLPRRLTPHALALLNAEASADAAVAAHAAADPAAHRAVETAGFARTAVIDLAPDTAAALQVEAAEAGKQSQFLRDIVRVPVFAFSPQWRTSSALTLARQMYESRDFSAMPILVDALQDAGCDNDDILDHCRGDEPHVRGCWVVDSVLGKE